MITLHERSYMKNFTVTILLIIALLITQSIGGLLPEGIGEQEFRKHYKESTKTIINIDPNEASSLNRDDLMILVPGILKIAQAIDRYQKNPGAENENALNSITNEYWQRWNKPMGILKRVTLTKTWQNVDNAVAQAFFNAQPSTTIFTQPKYHPVEPMPHKEPMLTSRIYECVLDQLEKELNQDDGLEKTLSKELLSTYLSFIKQTNRFKWLGLILSKELALK